MQIKSHVQDVMTYVGIPEIPIIDIDDNILETDIPSSSSMPPPIPSSSSASIDIGGVND